MEKLYVVVRADLAPGAQIAQSCHAVSAFASAFPDLHRDWHERGQNLVVLAAIDETHLTRLFDGNDRVPAAQCAPFYEPDLGDTLTAFAVTDHAQKILSSLPLALREPKAARAA